MMTGLYAAGLDMYYSADKFFDSQNLFDIRILSTLGLTQEDVNILASVDGVEAAEGGYIETVYTDINGVRKSADMAVLSRNGINMPQLLAGALPTKPDEIAVTPKYLDESGKSIGDVLIIKEDIEEENDEESTLETPDHTETKAAPDQGGRINPVIDFDMDMETELEEETEAPTFANTDYTITGVVLDPKDIRGDEDTGIIFRSTVTADYSFFITEEAASSDIFTVVYIILSGTKGMNSYSDEYEDTVQSVVSDIESRIKIQRERARYDAVISEAQAKIADAENTMNEKFAEADQKFSDAWRDIYEARQELADGEATLIDEQKDAERKIEEAREKLENAKRKLADAGEELARGEDRLAEAESELLEGEQELADGRKRLIRAGQQLADGENQLAQGEAELNANAQKLAEARRQLAEEREKALEKLTDAEQQINAAQSQLDSARALLEPGIEQLQSAFGDAWPTDEWNALVNAAAALAATGADDSDIVAYTASESAALAAAIQGRVAAMKAGLMQQISQAQDALDGLNQAKQKAAALQELAKAEAELFAGEAQIEVARKIIEGKKVELEAGKAELAEGWAEWEDGRAKLDEGWAEWENGKAELARGWAGWEEGKIELADGEAELKKEEADAKTKISDAWDEIADGKQELADGEAELIEKEQEYAEKKEEAQQKLADAYAGLDDIDMTRWYVQDRNSLDSYSSLNSDLSSIERV